MAGRIHLQVQPHIGSTLWRGSWLRCRSMAHVTITTGRLDVVLCVYPPSAEHFAAVLQYQERTVERVPQVKTSLGLDMKNARRSAWKVRGD